MTSAVTLSRFAGGALALAGAAAADLRAERGAERGRSALRGAGLDLPSSCEQGVCGTCECRVLEGEVEHRDSILSASERAANAAMMTCVSRAKGARLVLDI